MYVFFILTRISKLVMAFAFLQVVKGMDDVFESIHVISINVPISEISITLVLNIPHVVFHNFSGNVLSKLYVPFQHCHLKFTQNLKVKFINIFDSFFGKTLLQEGYLEELTRFSQCLNAKTGFLVFKSISTISILNIQV